MCIFDENVTDNITSYLACHSCSEILEYEKIYNEEKYDRLCKAQKQIHCIFTCFDKSYQKLENNKKKKEYSKKLTNDTNLFYMFDSYKRNFVLNTTGYFSFQYTERMMEAVTYRTCYEDYVVNVFKKILVTYIKHQIHLWRKTLTFIQYICI